MTSKAWASELGELLDARLEQGERASGLVSKLADGAAFEGWLSLEARLLLEQNRARMGLEGTAPDSGGAEVPRFWIANEWRKVDLYVGEYKPEDPEADISVATVEFKLIHNNKNWPAKLTEVRADLFPIREAKTAMQPGLGRLSFIGLVGKVYRLVGGYQGQQNDLAAWESRVMDGLSGEPVFGKVVWQGKRFAIDSPYLDKSAPNFFRLLAVRSPTAGNVSA